jgi:SSS family transporter
MGTAAAQYLDLGDWIIILLYLGGVVGFGLCLGRHQSNTRDYFLGGKNIPWWGIGLSIVAAETSALTIIGVPAMSYGDGGDLSFIQLIIGYVIARVILAIVMVPHYLKGEIFSPYQLFFNAFGEGARQTAGGFFLFSEALAAGVRVYVAAIPLRLLLGNSFLGGFAGLDPIFGAIVLFIVLSLIYTYVGGVKAVIWTDAAQFALFLSGGLFTLFFIPHLIDGGWTEALHDAGAEGKLHWLNAFVGAKSLWQNPINIWMGVIGGTFMVLSSHGAEQLIVQRVLACKNVADGRRALILSAVVILPLFFIFLFVGVMLWAFYQGHPLQLPIPVINVKSGLHANDFIFPIFILTETPHVLRGLLIVAILAAAMSSVSSALTALASVSTMDFARKFAPGRPDSFFLRLSKVSTIFWAGILVLVAYASRQVPFVLTTSFTLRGLTSGALLGGLFLAVFWRNGSAVAVISGMLVSLLVMVWISPLVQDRLPASRQLIVTIAFPWYTMIGCAVTLAVAWLVRSLQTLWPSRQNNLNK